ncbi:MAG TPA: Spy/CpxP family protein refolding chaperone [Pyrinomonadaceae bacterium]|nr:Spy/CpxP family protein refolding chaperone [Pyrinomonadaceae bacterium]
MMRLHIKRTATSGLVLFLLLLTFSAASTFAQTADEGAQAEPGQGNVEANWVTALGLTPDQVSRIRAIRQQNRLEMQAARQRLNQAQRALDQAIYSDDANEAMVEQRTKELLEAQAIEVRVRARTELGIRRVLTPEQLNTFRMIRQERIRAAQQRRRLENGNQRPLRNRELGGGGINQPAGNGLEGRPNGGDRRGNNPLLGPRPRRNGLPRRIRP